MPTRTKPTTAADRLPGQIADAINDAFVSTDYHTSELSPANLADAVGHLAELTGRVARAVSLDGNELSLTEAVANLADSTRLGLSEVASSIDRLAAAIADAAARS